MTDALRQQIRDAAITAGLLPHYVEAIVTIESQGDPWQWKPEPRYHFLWNVRTKAPFRHLTDAESASELAPTDFPCLAGSREQEWWAQQASWGLLQLMGAVAREAGFAGSFLPAILDVQTNLAVGCRVIRSRVLWAHGDLAKAAAAYNAGPGGWKSDAGQIYAGKVMGVLQRLEMGQ
jgi:hypothetical protein